MLLLFAFTTHLIAMPKAEKATPKEMKRFKEERIKRGFVPPVEQCSYENEDYWIKIVNTCRKIEGDGLCPSVMILIDKKKDLDSNIDTESVEIIQGIVSGMWHSHANNYVFENNDFKYWINFHWKVDSDALEDSTLKIQIKQGYPYKTIYKKELKSCDPNGKIS